MEPLQKPPNHIINADGKYFCAKLKSKTNCGGSRKFASPPVIMNRYAVNMKRQFLSGI